jgi:hypothetical protein
MNMVVRVVSQTDEPTSERQRYRLAGWAAIVAAIAFLVQPLSVGFLPFDLQEMRDPVELSDYWWAGSLQSAEFAVMAGAVFVLVAAARGIAPQSQWQQVTWGLGVVSGVGFLLQSALSAATYSWWLMQDASSFTPDTEVRSAILFGTFVVGYAFLGTANLATAGWLFGLIFTMRRAGLVGTVFTVFAGLVATVLVIGTVAGFTIPTVLLHLPLWLVLGVKLIRASAAKTVTAPQ